MPPQAVNSQWANWVQEAANDAVANGRREADSYKGAAKAIRAHHTKLSHPSEALELNGVGPSTVAIITSRLRGYCLANGLDFPVTPPRKKSGRRKRAISNVVPAPSAKRTAAGPHRQNNPYALTAAEMEDDVPSESYSTTTVPRNRLSNAAALHAESDREERQINQSASNLRPKSRTTKEYIPGSRTGGWGILIALYFAHTGAFDSPQCTKDEIIQTAQEYCDSSYTIPAARGGGAGNSGNFTAWSNMKKLKEEGLVLALSGRPAKWTLTQQGLIMARAIARQEALPQLEINEETLPIGPQRAPLPPCSSSQFTGGSRQNRKSAAEVVGSGSQDLDRVPPQSSSAPLARVGSGLSSDPNDARFCFTYLDPESRHVRSRGEADTKMDANTFDTLYKVEFPESQSSHQFKRNAIVEDFIAEPSLRLPTRIGWMMSSKAVPTCPGLPTSKAASEVPKPYPSTSSSVITRADTSHMDVTTCSALAPRAAPRPSVSLSEKMARAAEARRRATDSGVQPLFRPPSAGDFSSPPANAITPAPSGSGSTRPQLFTQISPRKWQAGTYDIRLLLDHRELKSTDDRSAFFDLCQAEALNLANKNEAAITVEQRVLPVGDALWIAVHKATEEEVVLDSIVERKRLDDLCTSIHDDRYHEQKARLKKSGLKDIIYLVENYNHQANQVKFGQMIQTAKAEVMVLNDCHLELTNEWRASVKYLIMRSRVIFEVHQNLDLWVIPDNKIDRASYLSTLTTLRKSHPDHYWVTSYPSFKKLNDKSANLNVRHIWARMAFCINGMSAEKVDSLVKHWDSPRKFWEAYKEHDNSSSQQGQDWSWIQDANESEFRRITPSLSKKIWNLFDSTEYDSQDVV